MSDESRDFGDRMLQIQNLSVATAVDVREASRAIRDMAAAPTVTGLDLTRLEANVAAHDNNPPLGPWDVCDGCHVDDLRAVLAAVPSLLAAARAVQRIEALCNATAPCHVKAECDDHRIVTVAALRAALGTEQEGRGE